MTLFFVISAISMFVNEKMQDKALRILSVKKALICENCLQIVQESQRIEDLYMTTTSSSFENTDTERMTDFLI